MYSKCFIAITRAMLISSLCILPAQVQAQSMGVDIAILEKILTELQNMRKNEIEAIKKSEVAPRGEHEEFLAIDRNSSIGDADGMKKLIDAAEKNVKETNKNINSQLDRVKNLHNVMIDKKNIDGLLKVQQLQLQLQSINASINTTNNQIQLDKFKTEHVARNIQYELKQKNRSTYIREYQRTPVDFTGQFSLGRHNNNQP